MSRSAQEWVSDANLTEHTRAKGGNGKATTADAGDDGIDAVSSNLVTVSAAADLHFLYWSYYIVSLYYLCIYRVSQFIYTMRMNIY